MIAVLAVGLLVGTCVHQVARNARRWADARREYKESSHAG